jgi:hypothetical protein
MGRIHSYDWSWLKGGLLQVHVQFNMECDLVQYEKKVQTIVKIHSQNLLGENNLEKVQKPSDKYHLEINATCIRIPI